MTDDLIRRCYRASREAILQELHAEQTLSDEERLVIAWDWCVHDDPKLTPEQTQSIMGQVKSLDIDPEHIRYALDDWASHDIDPIHSAVGYEARARYGVEVYSVTLDKGELWIEFRDTGECCDCKSFHIACSTIKHRRETERHPSLTDAERNPGMIGGPK